MRVRGGRGGYEGNFFLAGLLQHYKHCLPAYKKSFAVLSLFDANPCSVKL